MIDERLMNSILNDLCLLVQCIYPLHFCSTMVVICDCDISQVGHVC